MFRAFGLGVGTSILFIPALFLARQRSVSAAEQSSKPNIAVIGAGIGGSSSAHFLRELFGQEATIDVFEASDRIGGRLNTMEVAGKSFESGGSIIHPDNKYMGDFVKLLGFKKLKSSEPSSLLGIYNGDEFVFYGSRWKLVNYIKLIWRYGLFDLYTMDKFITNMLKNFSNIYKLQENGDAFNSVPEMLKAMGGEEFYGYTQQTARQTLEKIGLKPLLIDELVTAVMRINYGQDVTLNGFAGSVSLAGSQGGLWSVEGGNWKVCDGLLSTSKATVYKNAKITEVVKTTQGSNERPVYTLKGDSQIPDKQYDIVIVAAPFEIANYFFDCKDCKQWPVPKELGEFWRTVATFVHGQVNMTHFGFSTEDDIPEVIGTTETPKNYFNSVGMQEPVESRSNTDPKELPIRKVFSRAELSPSQLNELFLNVDEVKVVSWLAYPHYTPPEKFWSFVLDDGVFYVNAIEHSASAMEMSAVSAKNAALLAHQYYTGGTSSAHDNATPSNPKSEL
ncbi:hypothetical protein ACROYT_G016887 [Oculina patagonica]